MLKRTKADRNEQVDLTRSAGRALRVEGVVHTRERKDEFLRTLAPVSNVAPDARAKWLTMRREHANSDERQTAQLRTEIQLVFFPGSTTSFAEEPSIQNDVELAHAVERLHKLALANNAAIRAALTMSSQSSASAIKSRQFCNSLASAEKRLNRIL